MRYAVTGPARPLASREVEFVRASIELFEDVAEFTSGGADGVDTVAAYAAHDLHPAAQHRLLWPVGCDFNERLILEPWWHEVTGVNGGYMRRNDALVESCDVLIAFPATVFEVLRSGTWATIRRARKAHKRVVLLPLDRSLG